MSFLMIENRVASVPSIDMLCTLGASGSRGNVGQIGQFGSGFPYSMALFAREGILSDVKLCLGKDVYTFFTENVKSNTGNGAENVLSKIVMKKQNGGKYPLNISTGFGELDWKDVTMGVREFVSNAFDGSMESFNTHDNVSIAIVEDNQTRAKDGHIRIFLPLNGEIRRYYQAIATKFLMIDKEYNPAISILSNGSNETRFYRKGVLVGKIEKAGLFHYNIPDLELKESRTLDKWAAINAAGRAIVTTNDVSIVEKFIRAEYTDNKAYETTIDEYYLKIESISYRIRDEKAIKANWQLAYKNIFGGAIVSSDKRVIETMQRKGIDARLVSEKLANVLADKDITIADKLVSNDELIGRTFLPATTSVINAVNELWSKLERHNLIGNRVPPSIQCFTQSMSSEAMTMGYYKDNTIFIHEDISVGNSIMLRQTVLEEIAHYVTGATDNSRDFQDYAFRVAATFMGVTSEPTKSIDLYAIKEELKNNYMPTYLNDKDAIICGWDSEDATILNPKNMETYKIDWIELYTNYRKIKASQTMQSLKYWNN